MLNAKNILRTFFGLKSANLRTPEGFLQVECSYRKMCNELTVIVLMNILMNAFPSQFSIAMMNKCCK